MIELRNITKSYGEKTICRDLSLTLPDGVCTVLMGPSGIGKTTLLRIASGLEKPDAGEVIAPAGLRRSFVFQENRLIPQISALKNILCVAPETQTALYYLDRAGLAAEQDTPAVDLSGGMRRRLAIARALAAGGDVYFLDEPLRELDAGTEKKIAALLKETLAGKTALLITHDETAAAALGDRILRLSDTPLRIETE